MTKTAVALRHLAFEDLGLLETVLASRGYAIRYVEAGVDDLSDSTLDRVDLLVVLGGPIGAYEEDRYPFLTAELALIERRLAAERPTLGICLGAQLMARALGARIFPGPRKEIGFAPLALTEVGTSSALAPLGDGDGSVLHWHGDTFDLPAGAVRLAATSLTSNQAFARGAFALGLQFHAEVVGRQFERWLIGHTCEIASVPDLSPQSLREDARRLLPAIEARGRSCFDRWLNGIETI